MLIAVLILISVAMSGLALSKPGDGFGRSSEVGVFGPVESLTQAGGLGSSAGSENVQVIVVFKEGERCDMESVEDFELKYSYSLVNGVAGSASYSAIQKLSEDDSVEGVYLDGTVVAAQPVNLSTDNRTFCSADKVDVSSLWDEGIDGSGVVVAVLDSGIDENHPDLAGKVVGEKNFVDYERTTDDLLGHGTAVAGIIAGSGTASGGKYRGVAPGASLLNARVIDSEGSGQISDIIAGIEWALENDADVLSMSLGGINLGETNPPISMAADNAMDSGAVVCVAAGNLDERLLLLMLVASSVCLGCVESPGDGVKVITIGATDCDDHVALFSGTGPLRDGRIKPTAMAPGVNVVTTVPPNVELESRINTYYASSSGTSLATPVAAGLAALLLQANPDLTPAGVKAAMTKGAVKLNNTQGEEYESYYQGTGLLNARNSLSFVEDDYLCGVMPDHWTAGRWVYGDFQTVGDSTIYGSLGTGADRSQKKIYALAPGDVDWSTEFLFFTDKELNNVTTSMSGSISALADLHPLPREIPANGQRIFRVSISVPENAKPGHYGGSIDISEEGILISSVPLSLEVALPVELKAGVGTESGELEKNEWDYYYVDVPPSTDELRCALRWDDDSDLDLFLLSPTSEHYPAEDDGGLKRFSVTKPATGRWLAALHPRNITDEAAYLLEMERILLESYPKRWSLGGLTPGVVQTAQFNLSNEGPALHNVTYEGVVESVRKEVMQDSIEDKFIWSLTIDVPPNATRLGVKLMWEDPDTELALLLFNQNGRPVDVSYGNEMSEDVGVSYPAPGLWRAWVYGFDVRGTGQPFELEEVLYTEESWSWVSAKGPKELDSGTDGEIEAVIAVPNNASSESVEGFIQIRTLSESFSIPVSLTISGAALTGESRTDFVDEDDDGLFERLCIGLYVDVTVPGDYRIEGSLVDGNGTPIKWMSNSSYLEDDGVIEICVCGSEIWRKGECGPMMLKNLFLYNEDGEIVGQYEDEIMIDKCPEDFQPTAAQFMGSFVDKTTKTRATEIEIGVEISVQVPGEYVLEGRLVDEDGFEIDQVSETLHLEEGDQMVTLKFNPLKFMMKHRSAKLHLKDLTLSRNGEEIERLEDAWSTEVYKPDDFTTARSMFVIS